MRPEAEITIDGIKLTEGEAMVIRVAVGAFISTLGGGLGFRNDGVPIADSYESDAVRVHKMLLKSCEPRTSPT
jgi:hypothetical protein